MHKLSHNAHHLQFTVLAAKRLHAVSCRLRIKMVARVTMDDLIQHLAGRLAEWPAKQLQALEIVLNSPFINSSALLYTSRTLFPVNQVRGALLTMGLAHAVCSSSLLCASGMSVQYVLEAADLVHEPMGLLLGDGKAHHRFASTEVLRSICKCPLMLLVSLRMSMHSQLTATTHCVKRGREPCCSHSCTACTA